MKQKSTIVVFAGAGASKAVAPDKYPTTVEFFNELPNKITNQALFRQVVEFLEQESGNGPIDIELLLWRLNELKDFCAMYQDQRSLPGWILAKNRLSKAVLKKGVNLNEVTSLLRTCSTQLDQLVSDINARVYDLYGQLPNEEQLNNTWIPLLKGLGGLGARVELFTSNYDMIIESALDKQKVVDIGWRGSIIRNLDTTLWHDERSMQDRGLLTKLHGSINWTRNGDQIFVSDPMFKGDHDTHVIIYPGFKGKPIDTTFLSFHNHFASALMQASVAIFIGFAFRDEYVNDICERNTTGQTKIGILNPDEDLLLPFSNTTPTHWKTGFDSDSVQKILDFSRKALGV